MQQGGNPRLLAEVKRLLVIGPGGPGGVFIEAIAQARKPVGATMR